MELADIVRASSPGLLLEDCGQAVATVRIASTHHKHIAGNGLEKGRGREGRGGDKEEMLNRIG